MWFYCASLTVVSLVLVFVSLIFLEIRNLARDIHKITMFVERPPMLEFRMPLGKIIEEPDKAPSYESNGGYV